MGFFDNLRKAIADSFSVAEKAKVLTMQANTSKASGDKSTYNDGSQFSPGNPLTPQNQGNAPWRWQYQVGSNEIITPRTENGNLLPFKVLRDVAEHHDITALCIKMMIDQVVGDEWDIVVADKNDREHYEDDVKAVKEFFAKPDKVHLFNDWLKPILYDCLSIDAACIYKRRTRGGKLHSLEIVNGETIKPLIDVYGRVPLPPYAAFQQIIYGMPYGSSEKGETKTLGFTADEISYRPRYPRSFSVYGVSPIENILMKINIALRRDSTNLAYYTDGSMPDGGIYSFDNPDMTPDQIEEFATLYNDVMAGRLKDKFKLKFLPKGTYTATKEHEFDIQYDEWIARVVSIAFGVNPQAFIMMMNRSTGQLQDEQQTELGLAPLENFLAEWFTDIIQHDLGYPHLKFSYIGEKREDAEMSIKRDVEFVQSGILTIDEVRSQRGMPPITGLEDGTPPMVKVGNDVILLTEEYIKAKTEAQIQALQFGNVQGGNQSDLEAKIREAREKSTSENGSESTKPTEDDKSIADDKKVAQKAVESELRDFRKYVLNRVKKKSHGKRKFETKVISNDLRDEIYKRIEKAETISDIDDIFDSALYDARVSVAKENAESEIETVFEDITQGIIDNLNTLDEEVFETEGSAKKYMLLLLLLGDLGYQSKIDETLRNVLKQYAEIAVTQAVDEMKQFGGKIGKGERKKIIDEYIKNRMDFLNAEINRVTEERLGKMFAEAESVADIETGLSDNYALSEGRAKIIANNEFHELQNTVVMDIGKNVDEVKGYFITDGVRYDAGCIEANGSVWSKTYAMEHPLEHVNCVRQMHPIGQEFLEAWGGFDEE